MPVSIIDNVMTDKITLHGLDFVQVQLEGNQRLHVWHPELNHCFKMERCDDGAYMLFLHEDSRTAGGGRPWTPDGRANLVIDGEFKVAARNDYNTIAYDYHATTPGGDSRVATIMTKRGEYPAGAHSTCTFSAQPDTDFDRYQWSPAQLWEIVADVMLGHRVTP